MFLFSFQYNINIRRPNDDSIVVLVPPPGYATTRRCSILGCFPFWRPFGQAPADRPVGLAARVAIVRVSHQTPTYLISKIFEKFRFLFFLVVELVGKKHFRVSSI